MEAILHLYGYSGGVISRAGARRKRPGPQEPARRLRADAQLNRDRILDAAAELFAERGISAPLDEVARRAGVGVATLYRRFPTRADLAAATFERNISRFTEAVDRALAAADPWQGFRGLVFELCELQAGDAGLREMLTTAFPSSSVVEQRTAEAVEKLRELMVRAQHAGSLRADVAVADVVVMLLANSGVLAATGQTAPDHVAAFRRADGRRVRGRPARPEAVTARPGRAAVTPLDRDAGQIGPEGPNLVPAVPRNLAIVEPMSVEPPVHTRALIIGTGFSGLGMAHRAAETRRGLPHPGEGRRGRRHLA